MSQTPRQTAESILRHHDSIYVAKHDYAVVQEEDFPHLDLGFYRRTRFALEACGFVFLGDCENLTISHAPGGALARVLLRTMVSQDGQVIAGIYHAKQKSIWLRILVHGLRWAPGRIVDLETEFLDGSFIATSTATLAGKLDLPAVISREFLAADTPISTLLARHRERVEQRGLEPRLLHTLADILAAQERQQQLKAAFRRGHGPTREELLRCGAPTAELADQVFEEIQGLRADIPQPSDRPNGG